MRLRRPSSATPAIPPIACSPRPSPLGVPSWCPRRTRRRRPRPRTRPSRGARWGPLDSPATGSATRCASEPGVGVNCIADCAREPFTLCALGRGAAGKPRGSRRRPCAVSRSEGWVPAALRPASRATIREPLRRRAQALTPAAEAHQGQEDVETRTARWLRPRRARATAAPRGGGRAEFVARGALRRRPARRGRAVGVDLPPASARAKDASGLVHRPPERQHPRPHARTGGMGSRCHARLGPRGGRGAPVV